MAKAPVAPVAPVAPATKAVKSFVWSAKPEDDNITFLKGSDVTGIPAKELTKLKEVGLVE